MRYTVVCDSDIGKVRATNQDAIYVKHISVCDREIVFAVLCDGMGGFSEGELASTSVVKVFQKWFEDSYSKNIAAYSISQIKNEWKELIAISNNKLYLYGKQRNTSVGTTLTVMLVDNEKYLILNIGDGRVYELTKDIVQLTKDHSVVGAEVEKGTITKDEARFDKRRNQLLRSIGVLRRVEPDFFSGVIADDAVYMLCCDGVRNKVFDDEFLYYFHPEIMRGESNMSNNIQFIFELNKSREEHDNMSIILIKNNSTTVVLNKNPKIADVHYDKTIVNSHQYIDIEIGGNQ